MAVGIVEDAPEDGPQVAEVGNDLEQAHDREVADVREQRGPLGLQPVAAEADDIEAGHALAEVADELRSVEVARRFAARDQQAGHRKAQYSRVIRESQVAAPLSLPRGHGRRGGAG